MSKKNYTLNPEDEQKLISLICRFDTVRTELDRSHHTIAVYTNFGDNKEPTSFADKFILIEDLSLLDSKT